MFKFICSNCNKEFERTRCSKRDFIFKNHFCSKKCEQFFRKGKPKPQKKQNEIIIEDDYAIIKIKNNYLGDLDCFIDIEDIEKIKNFYWNIRYDKRHPKCTVYVESTATIEGKHQRIHLHRLITSCPIDKVVDHINGNGLDNRKKNLRIVTHYQNVKNRTDKLLCGVFYNKRDNYWSVEIGSKVYGRYQLREEAIKKRKELNVLIKDGQWDILENLKCISLKESNNGLQRNNKTGVTGVSKVKNREYYQVQYKGKYLGSAHTLAEAAKLRMDYVNSLKYETIHQE